MTYQNTYNTFIASKASTAYTASTASPSPPSIRKILIITYYWPPSGGAGVQRWLKFSRYLPQYGWEPVILTVDPEYAAYPAVDYSLEKDMPSGIKVVRTKATDWFRIYGNKSKVPSAGFATNDGDSFKSRLIRFIRGNFFIPDPRRGWNRFAFREACRIIEAEGIKHVITTGPPHSTQLTGLKLRKRFRDIKWIADLRDPWTKIYYYSKFYHTLIPKMIDSHYERRVLQEADSLITVGKSLKESFCNLVPGIENKFTVLPNGFDPEDFLNLNTEAPDGFVISYVGTLAGSYPVEGLTEALRNLAEKKIQFRLRFAGSIPEKIKESLREALPGNPPEFHSYLNHADALRFMMGSSVLLLIIPDHETSKSIITGKLFEYLASSRPVLCIGPVDGDSAAIIEDLHAGKTFDYNNAAGITDFLVSVEKTDFETGGRDLHEYSRDKLTAKLATVLESL